MKKLLAILLLSATALFGQVTPTAVIEIDGSNWSNASSLTGTWVGGQVTEYGNVVYTASRVSFNSHPTMGWGSTSDSLVFNDVINADTSNYVVFTVHQRYSTSIVGNVLDFRLKSNGAFHLIIPTGRIDNTGQGYHYGTSSNITVDTDGIDNTSQVRVRTWIFQSDSGKYYINGGTPDLIGGWQPTSIGTATDLRKLGSLGSSSADFYLGHVSVWKFGKNEAVDLAWVNNKGDSLGTYYNQVWTDIVGTYTITAPLSGTVWYVADTVSVDYVNTTTDDSTKVWLSRDNGVSFEYLGITDSSSFVWIVEGESAEQAIIRVATSDSTDVVNSSTFFIRTLSSLDIFYPIEKTGQTFIVGDTLHIDIQTSGLENVWLWWSKDSTNWTFIDSVAVDTVNGEWFDTLNYVWTFDGTVGGPEVWARVNEQADTTLYNFEQGYSDIGRNWIQSGAFICWSDVDGTLLFHRWKLDASCGWVAGIDWKFTLVLIDSLAESYYLDGTGICEAPHTNCVDDYPNYPVYYEIDGADTTTLTVRTLYTQDTLVTYQSRSYYMNFANDTLFSDDLVNDITGIFVADVSAQYTSGLWDSAFDVEMTVYNIMWTAIEGNYYALGFDYETENPSYFQPKIVIGQPDISAANTFIITVDALGYPNVENPAEDTQKILTGSSFARYFFRGIHPKINKD